MLAVGKGAGEQSEGEETEGEDGEDGEGDYTVYECPGLASVIHRTSLLYVHYLDK